MALLNLPVTTVTVLAYLVNGKIMSGIIVIAVIVAIAVIAVIVVILAFILCRTSYHRRIVSIVSSIEHGYGRRRRRRRHCHHRRQHDGDLNSSLLILRKTA